MEDSFNLHQTIIAIQQAFFGVTCHMIFDAALHGFALALVLGAAGFILNLKKNRYGIPLMNVCKKLSLVCALLALPGAITFLILGHLAPAGVFNVNSVGFIIFWSWISLHTFAEETNYCFFIKDKKTELAPEAKVALNAK